MAAYVDALQASGRYVFRRGEALAALRVSEEALKSAVRRLAAKGRLARPRRGFLVIVPLEYRSAGAPPASWFIDDLMTFLRQPYYVGLLTAAALHGAGHQQPQEFQVVARKPLRRASAGRVRIRFFTKRHIERTPIVEVKTETGVMRVSTPEATSLDLVRYVESVGHLGNVATVLADLAEKLDGKHLVEAAQADAELSCVQRLGYLLDRVNAGHVTNPLAKWLGSQLPLPVPLRPDSPLQDATKDTRWLVLVNETVEVDE
ncbi:MAG: type IV toxin-antitoxin system AbiEi family antitoxin [Candidatus Methylomirabilia bacterium]